MSSMAKSGICLGVAATKSAEKMKAQRASRRDLNPRTINFVGKGKPSVRLDFYIVEALHGSLDFSEGAHQGVAECFIWIAVRIVDERFDALHELGGAFLQAADLFFPNELFASAGKEVLEIGDVVLSGGAIGVAFIDPLQLGFK